MSKVPQYEMNKQKSNNQGQVHFKATDESFDSQRKNIEDIADAQLPKDIKSLNLSYNMIEFIGENDFTGFSQLQRLDLSHNIITKIHNLDNLTQITQLRINDNRILVLENIEKLELLKHLELISNRINSIFLKRPLKALNYLNLSQNVISTFFCGRMFPNLKELIIDNCYFTNFESLNDLRSLVKLSMSYNKICDEMPLQILGLKYLDISHNNLTSLYSLSNLINLEYLDVSYNPLSNSSLDPDAIFPNMKKLIISHTNITDYDLIRKIMPNVQEIIDYDAQVQTNVDLNAFLEKVDKIRKLIQENENLRAKIEGREPRDMTGTRFDVDNIDNVLQALISEKEKLERELKILGLPDSESICEILQRKIIRCCKKQIMEYSFMNRNDKEYKLVKMWIGAKMTSPFKIQKLVKNVAYKRLFEMEKTMKWLQLVVSVDSQGFNEPRIVSDHLKYYTKEGTHTFIICALDAGKQIVDYRKYSKSSDLIPIDGQYQTLMFNLREFQALFVKDISRLVPLFCCTIAVH